MDEKKQNMWKGKCETRNLLVSSCLTLLYLTLHSALCTPNGRNSPPPSPPPVLTPLPL